MPIGTRVIIVDGDWNIEDLVPNEGNKIVTLTEDIAPEESPSEGGAEQE